MISVLWIETLRTLQEIMFKQAMQFQFSLRFLDVQADETPAVEIVLMADKKRSALLEEVSTHCSFESGS